MNRHSFFAALAGLASAVGLKGKKAEKEYPLVTISDSSAPGGRSEERIDQIRRKFEERCQGLPQGHFVVLPAGTTYKKIG